MSRSYTQTTLCLTKTKNEKKIALWLKLNLDSCVTFKSQNAMIKKDQNKRACEVNIVDSQITNDVKNCNERHSLTHAGKTFDNIQYLCCQNFQQSPFPCDKSGSFDIYCQQFGMSIEWCVLDVLPIF